jgi:hypothetical protein
MELALGMLWTIARPSLLRDTMIPLPRGGSAEEPVGNTKALIKNYIQRFQRT